MDSYWLCFCLSINLLFWCLTDEFVCLVGPRDDEDHQEKTFSQVYDQFPEGWTPLDVLKQTELRERLGRIKRQLWPRLVHSRFLTSTSFSSRLKGKAHIRKATVGHEEALRIFDMCPNLNNHDVLREILKTSHHHSLDKYSEFENEEEFTDYMEAPNVLCESKTRNFKSLSINFKPHFSKL